MNASIEHHICRQKMITKNIKIRLQESHPGSRGGTHSPAVTHVDHTADVGGLQLRDAEHGGEGGDANVVTWQGGSW